MHEDIFAVLAGDEPVAFQGRRIFLEQKPSGGCLRPDRLWNASVNLLDPGWKMGLGRIFCTGTGACKTIRAEKSVPARPLGDAAFVERHACARTGEGVSTVHHFRALTSHEAVSTYFNPVSQHLSCKTPQFLTTGQQGIDGAVPDRRPYERRNNEFKRDCQHFPD